MLLRCFFVFSQMLTTAIQPPPPPHPHTTTNCHHHRPPPHSASCLSASGVCAPVGGRKKTTSASCNGWHHHRCKECLRQWLKEKRHQRKLQSVTISVQVQGAKVRAQGAIKYTYTYITSLHRKCCYNIADNCFPPVEYCDIYVHKCSQCVRTH